MTETPPPLLVARPDAPVPLVELLRRCLEKDPARRPQQATEIVRGLDQALVSSGHSALGAAGIVAEQPARRTNRTVVALAVRRHVRVAATTGVIMSRRPGPRVGDRRGQRRSVAVLPLENVGGQRQRPLLQ